MIVDFHSHTNESDGTLTPQALVDFMAERNVEIFSISDHDSLGAYGKFEPPPNARIVSAIEINTTWRDNEVHVLGYRLPLENGPLTALLAKNRAWRRTRMEQIIAQLQTANYAITLQDVENEIAPDEINGSAKEVALGRPHVAKALIRAGYFTSIDETFRALLTRGRPGYVPSTHIAPKEAIDAIHAAGGIAILAHPGRVRDDGEIITELAECGLDGLEVFYVKHDADDVQRYRQFAKQFRMAMTAGMDFHDIRYHPKGVGMEVERDDIKTFLDLVLT